MSVLREARRCLSDRNVGLASKLNAFTFKLATNEIYQRAQETDERIEKEGKLVLQMQKPSGAKYILTALRIHRQDTIYY